jgi:hypothetical protein
VKRKKLCTVFSKYLLSTLLLVLLVTSVSVAKKEEFDKDTKLVVRDGTGKQVGLLIDIAPVALILLEINGQKVVLKPPDLGELDESGVPLHGTVDALSILDQGGSLQDMRIAMPTALIIYESDDCSGEPFLSAIGFSTINEERLGLNFPSIGPPGLDPEADDQRSFFESSGLLLGNINVGSKRDWNLENGSLGECEEESAPGIPVQDYEEVGKIPEFLLPFSIEFE